MNQAIVSVGSNISPERHVDQARSFFIQKGWFKKASSFVKTKPLGYLNQDDFLNGAFWLETPLSRIDLDKQLKKLEKQMGRVPTDNKNGPRCIDLDIVVWNGDIVDNDVYQRSFLRNSILEFPQDLYPERLTLSCGCDKIDQDLQQKGLRKNAR